jgi:hypothetical protein
MTSGVVHGKHALQLHTEQDAPSNSRERPGAVDRAVAIASASQILVTAHLRYGQGISAGLVCASL